MLERLKRIAVLAGLPVGMAVLAGLGTAALGPPPPAEASPPGATATFAVDTSSVRVAPVLQTEEGSPLVFQEIVVTGYASAPAETDSTPTVTASMTKVRPGCLALSRDLLRTFTRNAPFDFGDWVVLPGVGIFIVQDTMHERWERRGDIWFPDRTSALRWGSRRVLVGRLAHPDLKTEPLSGLGPDPAALSGTVHLGQ
jgi:3D (Asp-Asp-Asp) domain-containing protein